jgi:hypothetical protein
MHTSGSQPPPDDRVRELLGRLTQEPVDHEQRIQGLLAHDTQDEADRHEHIRDLVDAEARDQTDRRTAWQALLTALQEPNVSAETLDAVAGTLPFRDGSEIGQFASTVIAGHRDEAVAVLERVLVSTERAPHGKHSYPYDRRFTVGWYDCDGHGVHGRKVVLENLGGLDSARVKELADRWLTRIERALDKALSRVGARHATSSQIEVAARSLLARRGSGVELALAMVALRYGCEPGEEVPDRFFWAYDLSEAEGKYFLFRHLKPEQTTALLFRCAMLEGDLFNVRNRPEAVPHVVRLLATDFNRSRGLPACSASTGWALEQKLGLGSSLPGARDDPLHAFDIHVREWWPSHEALEYFVAAAEALLRELGTDPLKVDDRRPAIRALHMVANNIARIAKYLQHDPDGACADRICRIAAHVEAIWPHRNQGNIPPDSPLHYSFWHPAAEIKSAAGALRRRDSDARFEELASRGALVRQAPQGADSQSFDPPEQEISPSNAGRMVELAGFCAQQDVRGLAISPGGRLIALTFKKRQHWNPDSAIAISEDGKAINSQECVSLHHPGKAAAAGLAHTAVPMFWLGFSPDGEVLASISQLGEIWLWLVSGGQLLRTIDTRIYDWRRIAFCSDGKLLVAGLSAARAIDVWDATEGRQLCLIERPTQLPVSSMAFSPSGRTLAAGSEAGRIEVCTVGGGAPLHTLAAHRGSVSSLAFSPDEQVLASGSSDGTVRLWSVGDGKWLRTLKDSEDGSPVNRVVFSPDGQLLATASSHAITVWQVSDGVLLKTMPESTTSVVFSADGRVLAAVSGGRQVQVWGVSRREV